MRFPGLILTAMMLQLGIGVVGRSAVAGVLALASSYGLVGFWLLVNLRGGSGWIRAGLGAVVAGYVLNLVAIVPNGGMPVSMAAFQAVGGAEASFNEAPNVDKHVAAGSEAVGYLLGDVVAVPVVRAVVSVGDVAMLVGVVLVLSAGMMTMSAPLGPART